MAVWEHRVLIRSYGGWTPVLIQVHKDGRFSHNYIGPHRDGSSFRQTQQQLPSLAYSQLDVIPDPPHIVALVPNHEFWPFMLEINLAEFSPDHDSVQRMIQAVVRSWCVTIARNDKDNEAFRAL